MTRRLLPSTAVVTALLFLVMGAPTLAQPDLEREARAIDSMLIAPCCFSQQVSVHQSPAADDVRRDVRARLAAGQNRQQILDAYVDQYGVRILAEPPSSTLSFYLPPLIGLFVSVGLLGILVRRFARRSPLSPASADEAPVMAAASPSATLQERLDDELRDLD